MVHDYPRDLLGYGAHPPEAAWPGQARIAVQFVLNYEEGAENTILHGDAGSEAFLSEMVGTRSIQGARCMQMESLYEYGSRAGFWRLHRLFTGAGLPLTVFGVAMALSRNPDAVAAMKDAGWEIASHGLRWIDYQDIPEDEERRHIREAIRLHQEVTGEAPLAGIRDEPARIRPGLSHRRGVFSMMRIPMLTIFPIMIVAMASHSLSYPIRLT